MSTFRFLSIGSIFGQPRTLRKPDSRLMPKSKPDFRAAYDLGQLKRYSSSVVCEKAIQGVHPLGVVAASASSEYIDDHRLGAWRPKGEYQYQILDLLMNWSPQGCCFSFFLAPGLVRVRCGRQKIVQILYVRDQAAIRCTVVARSAEPPAAFTLFKKCGESQPSLPQLSALANTQP